MMMLHGVYNEAVVTHLTLASSHACIKWCARDALEGCNANNSVSTYAAGAQQAVIGYLWSLLLLLALMVLLLLLSSLLLLAAAAGHRCGLLRVCCTTLSLTLWQPCSRWGQGGVLVLCVER